MPKRTSRLLLLLASMACLLCLLTVGANAAGYPYGKMSFPSMPGNWQNVTVKVGDVTLPLARFPDGHVSDDEEVGYLTTAELQEYGISNRSTALWTRGTTCVGFARHAYAALFYRYGQNATMDTALGTSYANSVFYYDVIQEVLGTRELAGGYSAEELKNLFSYCRPGAVFSAGWHTMMLMAIYDDGFLIYDCNFSDYYEVDVRRYTWQSFVNSMGSRGIQGLHMPKYYPGFSYSTDSSNQEEQSLDKSTAGDYVVYDCSALNVRTQPTTASSAVGTLPVGTEVVVHGTYNSWAQITYNGAARWVHTDYLRPKSATVEVSFDGGGATPSFTSRSYEAGQPFGTMPTASKSGRTLVGWSDGSATYSEANTVPVLPALTLKAVWGVRSYRDVPEDVWYAPYVEQGYDYGLISKSDYYYPNLNTTRAQFVTVLGREYERETGAAISAGGTSPFYDVNGGSFYSKYVIWGNANGLVLGYGNGQFGPEDNVSREQMALFMYRMAKFTGLTSGQEMDTSVLDRFTDRAEVTDYGREAMCWAVKVGLFQGDNLGALNPQDPCLRGEMITIFVRYVAYYGATPRRVAAMMPAPEATPAPSAEPSAEPTPAESPEPSAEPTPTESAEPTPTESPEPSEAPTAAPSLAPGAALRRAPGLVPSTAPSPAPSETPAPSASAEPALTEADIPPVPEGMVYVIFDPDGGQELPQPSVSPSPAPEQEQAAQTREASQDWTLQKYGAVYVLCCKPGQTLSMLEALPRLEKDGMTLSGWFDGQTEYTAQSQAPQQTLRLTARWLPQQAQPKSGT